jgi:hypothetical protein
MKKIFENPDVLKGVLICLGGFVALILVFGAGVKVGEIKARYSYRWAENYHKNFAGPRGGFMGGDWRKMPRSEFMEAHGAFGEIIELKDNGFVIKGRGDTEKLIVITSDTVIKIGMETVEDGLKIGDRVVVIGSPNSEGQIEAKLIRTFAGEEIKLPMKPSRLNHFF